ncbi:MAG: hypothetical protein ABIK89_25175 [Planctomycetota bacterium]
MPSPSKLEVIIFSGGLVASVVAGVAAYRIVGLYGDGPFASGYHRTRDPETGRSMLVHETRTSAGVVRRVIDGRTLSELGLDIDADSVEHTRVHVQGTEVTRVDRDLDGDGHIDRWEYYDAAQRLVKGGFSLAGDGVLDAWAYRNDDGQITKIEVSTRRDGTIDRWEYYENDQLARVEEDTDRDGRVDRWLNYEDGILMKTEIDADKDGRPDSASPR